MKQFTASDLLIGLAIAALLALGSWIYSFFI
jgi:hypothetical protein